MPKFQDVRNSLDDRTSFLDRLKFTAFRRKHTPIDPELLFQKSVTDLGTKSQRDETNLEAKSQPDEIEPILTKKQKLDDTEEQITSVSQTSNSSEDVEIIDNSNETIEPSEHAQHFPLSLKPEDYSHTHGIRRVAQANTTSSLDLNAESQSYLSMIEESSSF